MTVELNEPTSRDYEREAEARRHRLSDTLNELHDRLTPGDMLNEVLSYARGGSGTFLRALTNAARENPVPSLLIGAGCAMFLADKTGLTRHGVPTGNGKSASGSGYAPGAADAFGSAVDTVKDQASSLAAGVRDRVAAVGDTISSAAGSVSDTVSGAAQQVREGAHDVRSKVSGAVDQMKQTARGVGETVQDYSASVSGHVADAADRTRQQATSAARQVKNTATSLINEQPLLVAAVGLAIGAIIAAALPSTDVEDEFMGEASDAVKETVGEVASEQYDKAKAVATSVAQHAMTAAENEGLTASGAADMARTLGDKVKQVVTQTTESAGAELREKVGVNKQS